MQDPELFSPHPERRLPLTGAVNFRDIGGYCNVDSRQVKWGLLYRSDSLAELTDDDLSIIDRLQLKSLFDLRHLSERQHRPNRTGQGSVTQVHAIGFFPQGTETLMQRVRDRSIKPDEAAQAMRAMYRQLPVAHAWDYAQLLKSLLQPGALPALIHCTSGKDRTGFAIVLVLMVLGIPRETIYEDYQLTNHYRRDLSFMLGNEVDAEVLDVVKRAAPEFLAEAFKVIDEVWGGDQAFIHRGLGLTDEDQQQLRNLLLEAT